MYLPDHSDCVLQEAGSKPWLQEAIVMVSQRHYRAVGCDWAGFTRLGSQVVARVCMPWYQTCKIADQSVTSMLPELCRFDAIVPCVLLEPVSVPLSPGYSGPLYVPVP